MSKVKLEKMKAVVRSKYGPPEVLQISEVHKPQPKENELLIKIKASAVTNSDIFIRGSKLSFPIIIGFRLMMGVFKPKRSIIGIVFSGVVEETGRKTTRFSPGDEVYGLTGFHLSTYAEYVCIKETDSTAGCVSLKPKNISFEEATAICYGGPLALQNMEKGNIQKGEKILIYGASGTSGIIAVQYGKYLDAHVTAVCSGKNIDFVKSLGADEVIDYTVTDNPEPGMKFDFMLDSVGKAKTSKLKEACRNALKDKKRYHSIDDGNLILSSKRQDFLTRLTEEGKIKPVLDKIYPLEDIVEAHKYVEKGHKRGGVAISVNSGS